MKSRWKLARNPLGVFGGLFLLLGTGVAAQPQPTARITLIEARPVFVIPRNTSQQLRATVGMGLQLADTITTRSPGRAQIEFRNGVAFRLGGNASLLVDPQGRLNLAKGEMITWVKPGMKVPAEIATPVATAAIRGTTAFVEIPEDAQQGIRFFSWEGEVAIRLNGSSQEVVLKTGDEVIIPRGATVMPPVRRLTQEEWNERLRTGRFLNSFHNPLPTLPLIRQLSPGQLPSEKSQ